MTDLQMVETTLPTQLNEEQIKRMAKFIDFLAAQRNNYADQLIKAQVEIEELKNAVTQAKVQIEELQKENATLKNIQ